MGPRNNGELNTSPFTKVVRLHRKIGDFSGEKVCNIQLSCKLVHNLVTLIHTF